ncbi:polynucleotide adenylyltransferase PcnB [Simiduia sp. 21SJ11W-1]|uniref:polynucleotide adenylyltransferase PcnB n=1 Tax=Simiduia sp. 21SJ11W-1 TaxID=2909669 RepID=UPI00209E06B5|nr:polynucleotide adenylyltransferase PcnB [Simiduia sp. 21SJ11W-1]UTA48665.1 polynucleotide adenylyltransferase PcnB [Simiduia sp. 21SJ11W-1]
MLKRLFSLFPSRSGSAAAPHKQTKRVVPRDQHSISRANISRGALSAMKRLHAEGFEAYLVGGGVRDLLLDGNPKDFDLATDATPEQVRQLFRGARIIGRRFKIVHVRMGRELLEVTTFRDSHTEAESKRDSQQADSGMLLRDNVFGTLETDSARRDFTINALYYTSKDFTIHDYEGGLEDLAKRQIRMIGDPETRYKEDPVRMLRAVRFAAKLGFSIEPNTAAPIAKNAELLGQVSSSRLFDESLKLFMAGSATATFGLLREYQLLPHLFAQTHAVLHAGDAQAERLIENALINTDKRIRNEQRVTPAFIYAALLWPAVAKLLRELVVEQKLSAPMALNQAAGAVVSQQLAAIAVPKRFLIPMREIWDLQLRLPNRNGKRAFAVASHPRFRAAYDFLLLRESAGENFDGLGQWWTDFQATDEQGQEQMVKDLGSQGPRTKRRRHRKNTPKPQA